MPQQSAAPGAHPGVEPEGLVYRPRFLDVDRQRRLLARLEAIPDERWEHIRFRGVVARRRKLSFGVSYQPDVRRVRPAEPLPPWLLSLRDAATEAVELPAGPFRTATVQFYPPGAGIGPHRDAPMFGPAVLGLSLGAEGRLIFRRGGRSHELLLEPGSLVLVAGPARAEWTHELPPVKADRYSIYFRSLRPGIP